MWNFSSFEYLSLKLFLIHISKLLYDLLDFFIQSIDKISVNGPKFLFDTKSLIDMLQCLSVLCIVSV